MANLSRDMSKVAQLAMPEAILSLNKVAQLCCVSDIGHSSSLLLMLSDKHMTCKTVCLNNFQKVNFWSN